MSLICMSRTAENLSDPEPFLSLNEPTYNLSRVDIQRPNGIPISADDSLENGLPLVKSEKRKSSSLHKSSSAAGSESPRFAGYGDCSRMSNEELICDVLNCNLIKTGRIVIVDVRENRLYNTNRISGAKNFSCHTKLMVKRAILSWDINYKSEQCSVLHVIVYDQKSESPRMNSSLNPFLSHLIDRCKQVSFLEGGLERFKKIGACYIESDLSASSLHLHSKSPTSAEPSGDDVLNATASQILPFLFLGNERDTSDLDLLTSNGITHILNVTGHVPFYWEMSGKFTFKRLEATDCHNQNLRKYFEEANKFIDEARTSGGKVLVHCWAGVSRSATIVIAYLLSHTNLSLNDALEFVSNQRSVVGPNFNFLGQLQRYHQDLVEGVVPRTSALQACVEAFWHIHRRHNSTRELEEPMECIQSSAPSTPVIQLARPFLY